MLEKSLTTIIKLRVRFHECDPLQIVWHGNYFKYFEEGRECFGREHGISYLDAQAKGYSTPIVKSHCEHKLPLRYSDAFQVETTFINSDAAKLNFKYKIFKGENLICTGETLQVFLDENRNMMLNNPPFYLDWKKKMNLL
jgi:acyl-CoA thioester hydrolase